MRLHFLVKVAEQIHTQSRVHALGQLDRRDTPVSGGVQVALLARPSQRIGLVRQVDLS
jgi:hypothetical protein